MSRVIKFRAWDEERGMFQVEGLNLGWKQPFVLENFGENWKQFTGLTDKNGREVYEGDIIEVRTFLGEIQGTYTVEYKLNSFSYYAKDQPEQALYFAQNLVEVIGNIHENPELV